MDSKNQNKKYILGNQIGKGAFGKVYSAKINPEYFQKFKELKEQTILIDDTTFTPLIKNSKKARSIDNIHTKFEFTLNENEEKTHTEENIENNNTNNFNSKMAIKITKNEPKFIKSALREIAFLKELNLNNKNRAPIIKLLDTYFENEIPYLVFEKMDFNLYSFYKNHYISYSRAMRIFYRTTLALEYIHSRNIIHMDLKPENIMLDYNCANLKIIDFGSACYNFTKLKYFYVQSRYYRAPEVVFKLNITSAIDIWSLGCIIFEILFQKPLFPARESKYELIYLFSISLGVPFDLEPTMSKYFFSPIFKKKYFWNNNIRQYELKYKQINNMPLDKFGLEKRLRRKLKTEYLSLDTTKLLQILLKILTYNYSQRLNASQILEYEYLGDNI